MAELAYFNFFKARIIEMEIEALITSVDDPQLDRCLESVKGQTVPFWNIIHINNICPSCMAWEAGKKKLTGDWVMHIGGDMILHEDALERIIKYMEHDNSDKISGYYFGLYDTFLDCEIGFIGVLRTSLYKDITFRNNLFCDGEVVNMLRHQGWVTPKLLSFMVGTHFDQPDEFQVFKRCYIHGLRFRDHRSLKGRLTELFNKTGNPLYQLGIKAIGFAQAENLYPGGHNVEFEKKMFEKFKNNGGR